MDMFLYESVSCVCLWLSDEPVLFSIYVWNIVLFKCLDGPWEVSCETSLIIFFELNWIE